MVGVEISAKRSDQRKCEADGEAYYISETGKSEAEKVRLMGEAQGVVYCEQVAARGANGVALVETLKVIGEKNVRITLGIMASGGDGDGRGGIGTLIVIKFVPRPDAEKRRQTGDFADQRNEIKLNLNSTAAVSGKKQPFFSVRNNAVFEVIKFAFVVFKFRSG